MNRPRVAVIAALALVLFGCDQPPSEAASGSTAERPRTSTFNVLAVSWQPAFCETVPGKPECQSQTADRFDADHFTLHGLWPGERGTEYCGVSQADETADRRGQWDRLPAPALTTATARELETVMPGTLSALERHEWIRHGTCYGGGPELYFTDSLALMKALNQSDIRELFADAIGSRLQADDIREAFDTVFGAGAGDRVTVECEDDGDRRLIVELRLALSGSIDAEPDLGALLRAGPTRSRGCPQGIVDTVGLQ
jgi:ribonuclease T2